MEELNQIAWRGNQYNCCELGGRVVAVGRDGRKIKLTEFILGDTVQEKVVRTDLEAKWGSDPRCYSILPHKGRILLVGQSWDEKSVVSCLISLFPNRDGLVRPRGILHRAAGRVAGVLRGLWGGPRDREEESMSVQWLRAEIEGFEYGWNSELIRVGSRIIYSHVGGDPLWELEVDERRRRLTGRRLGIEVGHGSYDCYQPISDREMIVIGGRPYKDEVSLVDLASETAQPLPPLPYQGCEMSSILLLSRFVLVAGGYNDNCIPDMSIFDIQTRRWSRIGRSGDWWCGRERPLLSLSNGYVYIIEDSGPSTADRISLDSIACLIIESGVQTQFMRSMGYPQDRIASIQISLAQGRRLGAWSRQLAETRDVRPTFSCPVMM